MGTFLVEKCRHEKNRGGKGVITIKTNEKVGKLIAIMEAIDTDDLMLITDKGIMIRQPVENIRTIGINTQGVRLAKLDKNTHISSAERVIKDEEKNAHLYLYSNNFVSYF